jgi:hypothetical protein
LVPEVTKIKRIQPIEDPEVKEHEMVNSNFAGVESIQFFIVSVLVVLSSVLDDLVKPLFPVLVDPMKRKFTVYENHD